MKTIERSYKTLLFFCCLCLIGTSTALASATLTHRYSFTTDASDSVGTANGTLTNGASISGNAVFLNNPTPTGSSAVGQYVAFPVNIITGYTALTFETWVSYVPDNIAFGDFNRIWDFGNNDTNFNGTSSFFMDAGSDLYPYLSRVVWNNNSASFTVAPTPPNDHLLNSGYNHVVWTSDPQTGKVKIYLNGAMAGFAEGFATAVSTLIGSTTNNWLGRSQWNDFYLNGAYDEFRIYQGALNQLQVEADFENGADAYPTSFGTVTNLTLQFLSLQMSLNGVQTATVLAAASGLANKSVEVHDQCGVIYTSGNTSILTVDTNGVVTAVGTGSTTITAHLGSGTDVKTINVVSTLPPQLMHRYSFTTDASDSIGGPAFNGIPQGNVTFAGNQAVLDGTAGTYVYLPSGMVGVTNFSQGAVTFEAWASFSPTNGAYTQLFAFGNTDNGGLGENYLVFAPDHYGNGAGGQSGFLASSGDPGFSFEQDVFLTTGVLNGQNNVHIVCVMNPNPNRTFLGYYLNGVLVSSTTALTKNLSQINDVFSYLGRSLYSGDPYLTGSIDEFRIYNGELNKFQIAATQQGGPDSTNFNIGTFVSFVLGTGGSMPKDNVRQVSAIVNFTLATNVNVAGDSTLALTSSDTNVVTVNNAGNMIAHNPGAATITGTYQYISLGTTNIYTSSAPITVFRDAGALLQHRYSFTTDATDSVGGANGTLQGTAAISGGKAVLDGSSGTYVNLPGGLVSSNLAVTIEAWVTFGPSAGWARLFDFGTTTGFGTNTTGPANFFWCAPATSYGTLRSDVGTGAGFANVDFGAAISGQTVHLVETYDPANGVMTVYTNGVLDIANYAEPNVPLSSVSADDGFIGRSQFPGDPYLNASIDEFRIYNRVLYSDEVAATQILGPSQTLTTNAVLSASVSGSNLVLSWPLAAAGFTVESRTNLTSGAWTTVSSSPQIIGGTKWQAAVPVSGSARFYRLSR